MAHESALRRSSGSASSDPVTEGGIREEKGIPTGRRSAEIAGRLADAEARASALAADLDLSASRARSLQRVTSGLLRALTPAQVAAVLVRDGFAAVQADAGAVTAVSWEDRTVRLLGSAGFGPDVHDRWREFSLDLDHPVATAIRTNSPVWLPDREARSRQFHAWFHANPDTPYAAWAVLPLAVRERSLGALTLCYRRPGERTDEERTFMALLAQQCAQGLERARLYEAERAARVNAEFAERRVAFLANASERLAASLDHRVTLASLARLIVPEFADWVVLRASGSGPSPETVVALHRDPAITQRLRSWEEAHRPASGDPCGAAAALFEGRTELIESMTRTRMQAEAHDATHLRLLEALATRSRLSVPVRVRDRILGVIVLGASGAGRRYTATDRAVAEDLAARIGQAIDNAQMYESARAASAAKSDFLAVMSHELRTPLNAVLGYTDLILMGVPQPVGDLTRHQVERIRAAAGRLLRLVEEVLSFARLEADRESVHVEAASVADVVGDSVSLVEPIANAKGLEVRLDIDRPDQVLHTDTWKLRHILSNLLANAVKFTPEGQVLLRTRQHEEQVTIEVIDTGIGIAATDLDRIFDPFWQVDRSSTRAFEGTGLGLGVARELARLLGGDIEVESTAGNGSTFRVQVPVHYAHTAGAG